ncbi:MAG TPA: toll/interleukin-1 receptor domain-containing protein [Longimicrobium sp.]|nr:toll/interleukin-1 receptor domain-containing protein [Longimicrobium sp.]
MSDGLGVPEYMKQPSYPTFWEESAMAREKLFISYSHKDSRWLERVREQLGVLEQVGLIDVFDDSEIDIGAEWYERLDREMREARLALLLISASFLRSGFILKEEVPRLFARHTEAGMILYPLLVRDCAWQEVPWLARLQMRPQPLRPVASIRGGALDTCLAGVAREIASIVRGREVVPAPSDGAELRSLYPKIEQLIAIYSLLCWRNPTQQPPRVVEEGERGGEAFSLSCPDIQWGTGGITRPGELFSCFAGQVKKRDPLDGEEYEVYYLTPDEDFWYGFSWESLFGYELDVTINPPGARDLYELRDEVVKENRAMLEEELGTQADGFPHIPIYAVEISGLSVSRTVRFLVADGFIARLAGGAVDHVNEWVVYRGDTEPLRLGEIHKLIQLVLRRLQFKDPSLEKAVPELEAMWMQAGRSSVESVLGDLRSRPDLATIARFVRNE